MKRLFCLLSVLGLSIVAAPAASLSETTLANAPARAALSLNGRWHIIIDPYDNGYFNYRLQPYDAAEKPASGYFLDRKPANPGELLEYDFDRSPSLTVPGDWNSQDDKLLYYEGTVWYRTKFDYPPGAAGARQFLHFGAANYEAHVYLNGKKLGVHVGGFTPFQFEVTGQLKPAGNSLVVRVNNQRHPEGVPTVNTDWWNYGGLTRDVTLLETPPLFIRDYTLALQRGTTDRVAGFVQLDHYAGDRKVKVEIPELKLSTEAAIDRSGRAKFDFTAPGLVRWSPANPKLYAVTFSTDGDHVTEQLGFRTIEVRGQDILLNGEPVFLRGISLHDENPLRGGRTTTAAESRQLLGWAKDLGCNFVRLAHYPHNDATARTADELGLLLWAEVPVYWTIHWEDPATLANAENQLNELIQRDKNRASIIIWSMANETPVSAPRTEFLKSLVSMTRALDPTRLISAAMERHSPPDDPLTSIVEDPLAEVTDLCSFNEYVGWYFGTIDDCARMKWVIPYEKPVIISEFGADALQGLHGDKRARFTEEYQEDLYRQTLPMLEKIPQLRGLTPWILCDFRSPRRPLPNIQDGWNRKGLIGENGTPKKAFAVLREYYAKKAAEPVK